MRSAVEVLFVGSVERFVLEVVCETGLMMDGGRLGAGAESAVGASTRRFLLVDGFFVDSDLTSAVDTAEKDQFDICSE